MLRPPLTLPCLVSLVLVACGVDVMGGDPASDGTRPMDASLPSNADSSMADGSPELDASGSIADGSTTVDAADVDADALIVSDTSTCLLSPSGMRAWWSADGNMTDRASTHDGVSGTQNGASAVVFGAGRVASAFDLKGTSYVQVPNAAALQITAAITMEGWIYADTLGGRIVDKITAGSSDGYMLDTYASKLRLIIGLTHLSSTASLPTKQWVHVAATFDGTTGRLYVNGVAGDMKPITGPIPTTNLPVRLGADSGGGSRFNGKLDELTLYDRALSGAEIAAIAAAGANGRCK